MEYFCTHCGTGLNADNWPAYAQGAKRIYRCRTCHNRVQNEHAHSYYQRHPERVKATVAKWRAENPDKIAEYSKRYREENREALNAKRRANYAAIRDKQIEYSKSYRERNRELINERRRARDVAAKAAQNDQPLKPN